MANELDNKVLEKQSFSYLDIMGQDLWQTTWTPVRTGWTDVGTPTVTARHKVVGRQAFLEMHVVPSTSIATTAGTSYVALPVAAAGLAGSVTMYNATSNVVVGTSGIDVANSRAHLPSQVASGNTFTIWATWEV